MESEKDKKNEEQTGTRADQSPWQNVEPEVWGYKQKQQNNTQGFIYQIFTDCKKGGKC